VPEESGLELLYAPYVPNKAEYLILTNRKILADQMEFLVQHVSFPQPRHHAGRRGGLAAALSGQLLGDAFGFGAVSWASSSVRRAQKSGEGPGDERYEQDRAQARDQQRRPQPRMPRRSTRRPGRRKGARRHREADSWSPSTATEQRIRGHCLAQRQIVDEEHHSAEIEHEQPEAEQDGRGEIASRLQRRAAAARPTPVPSIPASMVGPKPRRRLSRPMAGRGAEARPMPASNPQARRRARH